MKNNRLSHSAVNKYLTCPTMYDLHYNKRLRPKTVGSALPFGIAVDVGVTALANGDKDYINKFYNSWTYQSINDEPQDLPLCTKVIYSNGDTDLELLNEDDEWQISVPFGEDWKNWFSDLIKKKRDIGFNNFTEDEKGLYNLVNWFCLKAKGVLMLEAVRIKVMPLITKVLGTQVEVTLSNGQGDTIIGYADLVANCIGYDKPIILDWKTSSVNYEENSVLESPQLALYVHSLSDKFEDTRTAGFIVLHKRIKKNRLKTCIKCGANGSDTRHKTCNQNIDGKRCEGEFNVVISPEVKVQIIIDDIIETTETLTIDNFDNINEAIKREEFPRNEASCINVYGKCAYYNLCHSNDSSDLITMEKKDERK